jgi:polyisoprenoid-binding protein YceI
MVFPAWSKKNLTRFKGGLTVMRAEGRPDRFVLVLIVATAIVALTTTGVTVIRADNTEPVEARYRIDAGKSTFMVRAFAGGLLWFKGHDHLIAVREFTGEVRLTPQSISPASLLMTIKSDSLVETRDVFTEQQKQIINRELREIVLESERYPEINFRSTNVTGKLNGAQFEAKIEGELTMHGVTRRIVIPAQVTMAANDLRARGEFTVDRGDFKIKATSAVHGMVRVRDKLKFTFDIVAHSY